MIRSMTGFGTATYDRDDGGLRVEIRSVNSRSLQVQVRGGAGTDAVDAAVREAVREVLSRGQVNVSLSQSGGGGSDTPLPELDLPRAARYLELMERLRSELGVPGVPDIASLARFGDIFRGRAEVTPIPLPVVLSTVREALAALDNMRREEGARLETDLRERLQEIADALDIIRERAPQRLLEERDRLRAAVRELTDGLDTDEDRLAREIAYLAERWDVNEEIVRLGAHLDAFTDTLDGSTGQPIGKRLSFLSQEMHREANTIGAKANDAALQHVVVTVKEEIDRLKEQLENVE